MNGAAAGPASRATPTRISGAPVGVPMSGASRSPAVGFARLPDRGDLVGYPTKRVERRDGAYTWHRADLSEAHALAAIADGSLRITTPSGQPLDFVYERHVEHPSGDWTWVGRLAGGSAADEVVLTFGDKAAFGSISQPGGEALRLTIRDGAAWLVETDPTRVADIHNRATQPDGLDYLVPPASAASREAAEVSPTMASAPTAAAATASSGPVIDLVLGYTPGFAAMYGGQSQAVTRLNNMVAITNETYANSQITGRVRLVHTLQVSYADNTDNGDALEKLTGYKSGTGWITADPAFSALRAARDQYGADLVSVVRKFNDPENDGCGIAWMIGGGGSRVDTGDEPFGYSVVSDGEDQGTDGKTYFCRHETLAHEIGHNLGSQHDKATATKDGKVSQGAHSYSFGYKTDSSNGNFYTVMAYGDSGQTRYRVFSNPRVTLCGSRVCGAVDQADNARSHDQTMPVIAQFRAQVVSDSVPPVVANRVDGNASDFDADGRADLLWRLGSTSEWAAWLMKGAVRSEGFGLNAGSGWQVLASGDFNADGRLDIIWLSDTYQMQMWVGGSAGFSGVSMQAYPEGWSVAAVGDVDGNGTSDIVWRNAAGQYLAVWLMQREKVIGSSSYQASAGWNVIGSGDLNGDGRLELIWTDGVSMQAWSSQGSHGFAGLVLPNYPSGWTLIGVANSDLDRKGDLYWHHIYSGQLAIWRMDGATRIQGLGYTGGQAWRPLQVSDFSGDGVADVVWTDGVAMQLWTANGASFTGQMMPSYPTGWSVIRR
ncbi:reprolysin-like metallopeptidase [Cognatilysobacter bugurensis]|nr:FG-GAP-like repeat-containing protein [Lysobacter bugurensis]